jgi:hypothetical protein
MSWYLQRWSVRNPEMFCSPVAKVMYNRYGFILTVPLMGLKNEFCQLHVHQFILSLLLFSIHAKYLHNSFTIT